MVIVGYFQNDTEDNVRSDLFRLDARKMLVRGAPASLPAIEIRDRLYSFWLFRCLAERSHLFALLREHLAGIVKPRMVQKRVAKLAGNSDRADYSRDLTARLLDEMARECREHGARLFVLDIPDLRLRESNLPIELVQTLAHGSVVRPLARFQGEGPDAYLYRQRGHFHWTPRGHEIAAELLAEKIAPMVDSIAANKGIVVVP